MALLRRLLRPIVELQESEAATALLMFLYSFLAMTSYNILKPLTRSQFIKNLGADNLPWVLLAAGVLIGVIMQGYSKGVALLPRKWVIPITQTIMAGVLVAFWFAFQTKAEWVSVAFYFFGLILGVLLISQFWTLANEVYDPRQAKRIFGFVGGGSSLGGIMGSTILTSLVGVLGPVHLLLVSAAILLFCAFIVSRVLGRERHLQLEHVASTGEEKVVSDSGAINLLRNSKHLQVIALVIGFAAIGAAIIEQQLNMAAAQFARQGTDLEKILGSVQLWLSIIGFTIQIWLTSRIHRLLGIGFALLILPVSLGSTALIMLFNAAIWAPMLARISDTALRYTVDKTTREILFLPLPSETKAQAKPFIDVTMDRLSKGIGAALLLVLIKDWGLGLTWQQLSYASITMTALWIFAALAAKKRYLLSFRQSIERKDVVADDVRIAGADLQTIETLVGELADPNEQRVIYAIDILESLDKRSLVTPLLLYHESPKVRARALRALGGAAPAVAERWLPGIKRMLQDGDVDVRTAAVGALAHITSSSAADLVRPYVAQADSRMAATAAVVLARSGDDADRALAEETLSRIGANATDASARRDVAIAIRQINTDRFHDLLVPLLYDSDPTVASEAMRSVRQLTVGDFRFVPTLISLLRDRRAKSDARDVLIGYGEEVVDALAFFLNDTDEDPWVRRHIPATLARIPCQKSMDALVAVLQNERDGFVRFKLVSAIDRLHREHPELALQPESFEPLAVREARHFLNALSLGYNLTARGTLSDQSLLARALGDRQARSRDRLFTLLGIMYPPRDIDAARFAIDHGDPKARASALEYLDNVLSSTLRKRVLPVLDDAPLADRVRKGNAIIGTRQRDEEETLVQLVNDDDQVIAASAILLVAEQRMTRLADDLEHILEYRDARDWYVFEAASWALAGFRMSEDRRRSLWNEPLPAVEIASRLSRLPLFASTWVDELFRLAVSGRQVRYEPGAGLYQEGTAPQALQFLLDGDAVVTVKGAQIGTIGTPAPLAFEEVVQGAAMRETIRTTSRAITLSLSLDECATLLEENTDLVQGLFRTIVTDEAFAGQRMLLRGAGDESVAQMIGDGVSPVEKVLAMQRISTFAPMSTDDLLHLANVARRLTLAQGASVFTSGDAPRLIVLLSGEVALEADGAETIVANEGDAIGVIETLAGVPIGRNARVVTPGAALVVSHDDLFDLLAQRPALLQQLFAVLFGRRREAVPVQG